MTKVIPEQVLIETINGICSADCIMCSKKRWTRRPHRMDDATYTDILGNLKPYRKQIQMLSLFGCGEPLLDPDLVRRVHQAREEGFQGIGIASNCTALDEATSRGLIAAGLNTIICSIDGYQKATHEAIRVGTDFGRVVENVQSFIRLRNESGTRATRVIIRFIRQQINQAEWPRVKAYWQRHIRPELGDKVIKFNIHNWGGKVADYPSKDVNREVQLTKHRCLDLWKKLLVRSRGEISFCDTDDNVVFDLGNARMDDPIEVYNRGRFVSYRTKMLAGRIMELVPCRECSLPRSLCLKTEADR